LIFCETDNKQENEKKDKSLLVLKDKASKKI